MHTLEVVAVSNEIVITIFNPVLSLCPQRNPGVDKPG